MSLVIYTANSNTSLEQDELCAERMDEKNKKGIRTTARFRRSIAELVVFNKTDFLNGIAGFYATTRIGKDDFPRHELGKDRTRGKCDRK